MVYCLLVIFPSFFCYISRPHFSTTRCSPLERWSYTYHIRVIAKLQTDHTTRTYLRLAFSSTGIERTQPPHECKLYYVAVDEQELRSPRTLRACNGLHSWVAWSVVRRE